MPHAISTRDGTHLEIYSVHDEKADPALVQMLFVTFGVLLPVLAFLGVVGNMLTLVLLWRLGIQSSTSSLLLKALAITDAGILGSYTSFFTPISWSRYYPGTLLYFRYYFLPNALPYYMLTMRALRLMNVWIVVAISTERYIAICHPFQASKVNTRRTGMVCIATIAVFAMLIELPRLAVYDTAECDKFNDTTPPPPPPPTTTTTNTTTNTNTTTQHDSKFRHDGHKNSSFNFNTATTTTTPAAAAAAGHPPVLKADSPSSAPRHHNLTLPFRCLYPVFVQHEYQSFNMSMFYFFVEKIAIFLIPILFIFTFNFFLVRKLISMQRRRNRVNAGSVVPNYERNISYVLVLDAIVFLCCQFPDFFTGVQDFFGASYLWYLIGTFSVALNASIDFIIYTTIGLKFRKAPSRSQGGSGVPASRNAAGTTTTLSATVYSISHSVNSVTLYTESASILLFALAPLSALRDAGSPSPVSDLEGSPLELPALMPPPFAVPDSDVEGSPLELPALMPPPFAVPDQPGSPLDIMPDTD